MQFVLARYQTPIGTRVGVFLRIANLFPENVVRSPFYLLMVTSLPDIL